MTDTKQGRDRAYMRHVHIKKEDTFRLDEYLETIDRPKLVTKVRGKGDDRIFHVRIKREEELYIGLAFKAVIKKPRAHKIKNSFGAMVWRKF